MPLGMFADPSQWVTNNNGVVQSAAGIQNPAATGALNAAGQISPPGQLDYASLMKSLISSVQAPAQPAAGGMNAVTKSFLSMMQKSNEANAQRGQAILSLLQGQGQQAKKDNQRSYEQQAADIDTSMMAKGLSGTTVGDNLKQGARNELAASNAGVTERAASGMANMANGFTQEGPSMELLAKLLGEGGGAGGGGGAFRIGGNQALPLYMQHQKGMYEL